MKYKIDHDFHIHTYLSSCSNDPEQNIDNIVNICKKMGYKKICITNHAWDSDIPCNISFYNGQDLLHNNIDYPYKKYDDIIVCFGLEVDMDYLGNLGITIDKINNYDFVIIPTTHFHIAIDPFINLSFEEKAKYWVNRLDTILNMNLPFKKIGIAHLTTSLISKGDFENHLKVIDNISDNDLYKLFNKASKKQVGIEINVNINNYKKEDYNRVLRPYKIAKECGCKFYLGGDSHHLQGFQKSFNNFKIMIDLLDLKESDKFVF